MATVIDAIIRLRDQFTPNLNNIRRQLSETQRATQRSIRNFQRMGSTLTGVAEKMAIPATAIGGALVKSGQTFMDFEKIMTQAKIRSQATGEEFGKMMDAAIEYAGKYPASGAEVAQVFDTLAASGFKATQQIGMVPAVIEAAMAAGGDIQSTADNLSVLMNSYKLKGSTVEETKRNAAKISDILQTCANNGKIDMAGLANVMQYAAAPAAAAKVPMEDLAASIDLMANAGLEASQIGTSLRATMLRLAAEPKTTAKALQKLGVDVKGIANGDFSHFGDILDALRKKMEGLNELQQLEMAKGIVGVEAASGFVAMIKAGGQEYNRLRDAAKNSAGASTKAFEEMNNTIWGQIKGMESAIEEIFNVVGKALKPQIAVITSTLKGWANAIKEFSTQNPEAFQKILHAAEAFIGLTAGLFVAGKAMSILGALASPMINFANAINRAGSLSAAAAGRFAGMGNVLTQLKNAVVLIGSELFKPFTGLATILVSPFRALQTAALRAGNVLAAQAGGFTAFRAFFRSLGMSMGLINAQGVGVFGRLSAAISGFASSVASKGASVLNFFKGIPGAIIGPLTAARNAFNAAKQSGGIMGVIRLFFQAFLTGIRMVSAAFVSNPIGIALLALVAIIILVKRNWELFSNVAQVIWNKIKYVVTEVVNNLRNRFEAFKARVSESFSHIVQMWNRLTDSSGESGAILTAIVNTLGSVFTVAVTIIISVLELLLNNIMTIIEGVIKVLDGVITFITGVFTLNWELAWEGVKKIFTGIVDTLTGIWDNFCGTISSALDRIMGKADTANAKAADAAKKQAVFNNIANNASNPDENASGTPYFPGGLTWVGETGPELVELPKGSKVIPSVNSFNMAREMIEGLRPNLNIVNNASDGLFNQLASVFKPVSTLPNAQAEKQGFNAMQAFNPITMIASALSDNKRPEPIAMEKSIVNTSTRQDTSFSLNVAKLADSIVVREDTDIDKITDALVWKLKQFAVNRKVAAV